LRARTSALAVHSRAASCLVAKARHTGETATGEAFHTVSVVPKFVAPSESPNSGTTRLRRLTRKWFLGAAGLTKHSDTTVGSSTRIGEACYAREASAAIAPYAISIASSPSLTNNSRPGRLTINSRPARSINADDSGYRCPDKKDIVNDCSGIQGVAKHIGANRHVVRYARCYVAHFEPPMASLNVRQPIVRLLPPISARSWPLIRLPMVDPPCQSAEQ
jgi:hypothetical protein